MQNMKLSMMCAIALLMSTGSALAQPPVYGYEVLNTYPHDTSGFTQGLILQDGRLYESSGLYGESSLRELDRRDRRDPPESRPGPPVLRRRHDDLSGEAVSADVARAGGLRLRPRHIRQDRAVLLYRRRMGADARQSAPHHERRNERNTFSRSLDLPGRTLHPCIRPGLPADAHQRA